MSILAESPSPYETDQLLSRVYGHDEFDVVWIIVGADQAEAAAECEPDAALYCLDERALLEPLTGLDFSFVEDKKVKIFPLGDAASAHDVFEKSTEIGRLCDDELAAEVLFVWLGHDLDDWLGDGDLDARKAKLTKLVTARGHSGKKPARAKPKAPSAAEERAKAQLARAEKEAEGRPIIDVSEDRLLVLNQLVAAMQSGKHGEGLFCLGSDLTLLERNDRGALEGTPIDDKKLLTVLSESAMMVALNGRSTSASWLDSKTLTALYGRQRDFRPLRGISPSPIVRQDGTIADTDGYDEESQVLLDLAGLTMQVPEDPTPDEVRAAVELLRDEWLGDFPFVSDADRANMLALILTYPLRDLVSLVPLAVISAKSMGTGKSKLFNLVYRLFTRTDGDFDSLPASDDEARKQITTLLQKAPPFICFDESPEIGGKSVNRLLTAHRWSDRLLGGNERASYPNRAVMVATGNNVQVDGDTARRYFPIELFSDVENPENRPESSFRHPDIDAWTEAHRGDLLTAVFTLIRAWQVAGEPRRTTSFGSFEQWEAVVGGVLENAGVEGFLGNLRSHRKASNFEEGVWLGHYAWLEETFRNRVFTARDVVDAAVVTKNGQASVASGAVLPPDVERSPFDPLYTMALGKAYLSREGRYTDGLRIRKHGNKVHGGKSGWYIEVSERLQEERVAEGARRAEAADAQAMDVWHGLNLAELPKNKARLSELEAQGDAADPQELKRLSLAVTVAEAHQTPLPIDAASPDIRPLHDADQPSMTLSAEEVA